MFLLQLRYHGTIIQDDSLCFKQSLGFNFSKCTYFGYVDLGVNTVVGNVA